MSEESGVIGQASPVMRQEAGVTRQASGVRRDDEREIVGKLALADEERQTLMQRLDQLAVYTLRLEGALVFVRGKLGDDEESVQTAAEATAPA